MEKEVANQAFWLVDDQRKLTDGQSNLLLSNEASALDDAIDGVIFPDCVIRVRFFYLKCRNFFQVFY